jgi:hypothetical protein
VPFPLNKEISSGSEFLENLFAWWFPSAVCSIWFRCLDGKIREICGPERKKLAEGELACFPSLPPCLRISRDMLDRRQEDFQVDGGEGHHLFGVPDPAAFVPEGHAKFALQFGTGDMGPEAQ